MENPAPNPGAPPADPSPSPAAAEKLIVTDPPRGNPPAAAAVLANAKTPRELKLEKELAEAAAVVRQREIEVSELEDKNRQLSQALQPPPAPPKKKKSGWTPLIGADDDEE